MKNHLIALVIFLGSFGFYLKQVAPGVTSGDSGEFITAAATLSIPHAPSFPTFTLTARAFMDAVPWGSVGYKCNAFSAFCAALSLVIVFFVGLALGAGATYSVLATLMLGVTASSWENSLVTEVFALNSLFTAALIWCLARAREGGARYYVLYAFLLGLGLGNHHIAVLTLPAFVIAVLMDPNRNDVMKNIGMLVLFGAIGLSVYFTLPIRSMKEPPLNWGKPTTISKMARTITRKDYGALTLALGEKPERSAANTTRHLANFARHFVQEVPWPVILLGVFGFVMGLRRKEAFSISMLTLFVLSGPFFLLLGNLPFNAQSDGIIGRFYIMPVMAFLLGGLFSLREHMKIALGVLIIGLGLGVNAGWAHGFSHRNSMLVIDYARSMLRTLPPNAALFMDGGDDTFYSLAALHYADGKRPDVELHDRGGLVFKNAYGDDFRSLTREQKALRRIEVERSYLGKRDLFYSTMDSNILPGVRLLQVGFLIEAAPKPATRMSWPLVLLRSLYPLELNNYRSRALAAFFPYMRGKSYLAQINLPMAMTYFKQASVIGYDIDWLRTNLGIEFGRLGYAQLMASNPKGAEVIYRQWIEIDPMSDQAHSNLGVALERQWKIEEAKAQYLKTMEKFPNLADPVFNLAVLAWKAADWPTVVSYFEETLKRDPNHKQAEGYLRVAREKLKARR